MVVRSRNGGPRRWRAFSAASRPVCGETPEAFTAAARPGGVGLMADWREVPDTEASRIPSASAGRKFLRTSAQTALSDDAGGRGEGVQLADLAYRSMAEQRVDGVAGLEAVTATAAEQLEVMLQARPNPTAPKFPAQGYWPRWTGEG